MVSWILLFIVIGFISQYIIHIIDTPRRKWNYDHWRLFPQYGKPEPMWFEIITTTNQILVCGGIVCLFLIFILKMLPI